MHLRWGLTSPIWHSGARAADPRRIWPFVLFAVKEPALSTHFDAVVVGTGQSGAVLAQWHSDSGRKVTLIECRLLRMTFVSKI